MYLYSNNCYVYLYESKMTDKRCPLAEDIKTVACKDGHVHLILLDETKKELAEFVFETLDKYNNFAMMLGMTAYDAFVKRNGETLQ